MTKTNSKNRKRSRPSISTALEVSGVTHLQPSSIESCLEELEAQNVLQVESVKAQVSQSLKSTNQSHLASLLESDLTRHSKKQITEESNAESSTVLSNHSIPTLSAHQNEVRDRVRNWNIAVNAWITRGTYTLGTLPCFELEVARHIKVQQLSSYLLASGARVKMPSFERWLIDSKMEAVASQSYVIVDPVLSPCRPSSPSCQRLGEELRDSGLDAAEAKKTVHELCRRTDYAINELLAQSKPLLGKIPFRKGERIDLEKHGIMFCSLVLHSKRWKSPFRIKITNAHYSKLQAQFLRVHNKPGIPPLRLMDAGKPTKAMHCFHYLVMSVVVRYSSLSGGQLLRDLRGGGMQGAVHGEVFEGLRQVIPHGRMFECFASPLNSYLSSYGSLFYDLDWHFGSAGDFASLSFDSGCFQANPPFSPALMNIMVDRMESSLAEADRMQRSLSFVVIVPSVQGETANGPAAKRLAASSFGRMIASSYLRRHVVLPAREHGYIEGSQHLRPTRYKESLFDTSVILLQSQLAFESSEIEAFEATMKKAFTSRHVQELHHRHSSGGGQKQD